jgi:hypothetical protein
MMDAINDVTENAVLVPVEAETETGKNGVGMSIPKDVVHTPQPLPTAPMVAGVLLDEGDVSDAGERVKKAHKKDKSTGVSGRLETMALTTANVASFFMPKYGTPRSKEQRAANPRPSAI